MQDQDIRPCQCEPGCKIPYGYCHDGCGQLAGMYAHSYSTRGIKKGQVRLYLDGHHTTRKGPEYEERDLGYTTPCWIWLGGTSKGGYPRYDQNRNAHRVYYERYVGPVPEGWQVDHLCHNADPECSGHARECLHRRCVRPIHLEAKPGAANHRAGHRTRLTIEQVRDIRSRPVYHGSQVALAEEFGVHPTTIYQILTKKIWVDTDYSGT